MLLWKKELWLIDHGASLYFHHSWQNWSEQALKPFVKIQDHVLLPLASDLERVDEEFRTLLSADLIDSIVNLIPESWLLLDSPFETVDEHRSVYAQYLNKRIAHSANFVNEAINAR